MIGMQERDEILPKEIRTQRPIRPGDYLTSLHRAVRTKSAEDLRFLKDEIAESIYLDCDQRNGLLRSLLQMSVGHKLDMRIFARQPQPEAATLERAASPQPAKPEESVKTLDQVETDKTEQLDFTPKVNKRGLYFFTDKVIVRTNSPIVKMEDFECPTEQRFVGALESNLGKLTPTTRTHIYETAASLTPEYRAKFPAVKDDNHFAAEVGAKLHQKKRYEAAIPCFEYAFLDQESFSTSLEQNDVKGEYALGLLNAFVQFVDTKRLPDGSLPQDVEAQVIQKRKTLAVARQHALLNHTLTVGRGDLEGARRSEVILKLAQTLLDTYPDKRTVSDRAKSAWKELEAVSGVKVANKREIGKVIAPHKAVLAEWLKKFGIAQFMNQVGAACLNQKLFKESLSCFSYALNTEPFTPVQGSSDYVGTSYATNIINTFELGMQSGDDSTIATLRENTPALHTALRFLARGEEICRLFKTDKADYFAQLAQHGSQIYKSLIKTD
jgi:tetratricopeptide (TPR) repeat protein